MPSHQPDFRSPRRTGASRWSVALRIVMLLAAWQGPMPWWHRHGTLVDADLAKAPLWLSQHLQTHHASVSPYAGIFFGWHMHAIFPGSSSDDPEQPTKPEQFRLSTAAEADCLLAQLMDSAEGLSVSLAQQIELQRPGLAGSSPSTSRATAHFFERFAPSLPLPLRFCVARC